jgi:hypothetical protein
MNIYRVIITARSSDCISALSVSPRWSRSGDNTFETVQEAYNEDVAKRRAWSSFSYHSKAWNYWDKSNAEAIHAELLEKIRRSRRQSTAPAQHHPTRNPDIANKSSAPCEDQQMQPTQPSVPELRINRELRFRFEHEYGEKFKRWQKGERS